MLDRCGFDHVLRFRENTLIHEGDGQPLRASAYVLLIAISKVLLTLLGAASEASGLDRTLKANTVKTRTMSLINQGLYWYSCLATMREEWFARLMTAYESILQGHAFLAQVLLFNTPLSDDK